VRENHRHDTESKSLAPCYLLALGLVAEIVVKIDRDVARFHHRKVASGGSLFGPRRHDNVVRILHPLFASTHRRRGCSRRRRRRSCRTARAHDRPSCILREAAHTARASPSVVHALSRGFTRCVERRRGRCHRRGCHRFGRRNCRRLIEAGPDPAHHDGGRLLLQELPLRPLLAPHLRLRIRLRGGPCGLQQAVAAVRLATRGGRASALRAHPDGSGRGRGRGSRR